MMPAFAALDAAIAFLKRYKALIAIIPLCLALAWQTARIEGFLWFDGYKEKLQACRDEKRLLVEAGKRNLQEQIAQRERDKATFQRATERAKVNNVKERALGHSGLDRYIAANRVRKDYRGSTASNSGQGPASGSADELPNGAVLVSEADLRICTDNTAALVTAYQWGQDLIREGKAIAWPEPALSIPAGATPNER